MKLRLETFGIIAAGAVLTCLAAAPSAAGDRLKVEFTKSHTSSERGLEYEYLFTITDAGSGKVTEGAKFEVATDMPSMPGAHHMPHAAAEPTSNPGEYVVKINFDMAGVWTLVLRFSEPRRDVVTLTDTIGGDQKAGPNAHDAAPHTGHHQATGK